MATPTTDLDELEQRVYDAENRLYRLDPDASPGLRANLQAELDQLTDEWITARRHERQILTTTAATTSSAFAA
jgi:hypothetical protein